MVSVAMIHARGLLGVLLFPWHQNDELKLTLLVLTQQSFCHGEWKVSVWLSVNLIS